MNLRYFSVCSGIEAATDAWHSLGWTAAGFAEIEAFPSAVLAARYGSNMPGEPLSKNGIPNYGDFTKITDEQIAAIGHVDLLVGGTPCQSFSVAGKRLGLDDPRGNLALEYLRLARRLGAKLFCWENVPGVLSSYSDAPESEGGPRCPLAERKAGDEWDETRDFATFLEFVRECGYGFAYRILDAQYVRVESHPFAVPQRRERLFVIGYLGDWRRAAAILLEPEGMRGHPPPRRKAGQGTAGALTASSGRRGGTDDPERGRLIVESFGGGNTSRSLDVSTALTALTAHGQRIDFEVETFVVSAPETAATLTRGAESAGKGGYAGRRQEDDYNLVAHALRGEGFDASEDGTGRGVPIVPVAFGFTTEQTPKAAADVAMTLTKQSPTGGGQPQAVAFDLRGREGGSQFEGPHETANIRAGNGGSSKSYIAEQWAVRRLTPTECARLQGRADDYTRIAWRGKPPEECPDGPRYKAEGNSMAANVMRWIGERIDLFETLVAEGKIPS